MHESSSLVDALVCLAAAVLIVPIATRLKLGSVLGYLLAGVLVGPSCLHWVHDVESKLHFSDFGIVLMLFVIGLELEPKRLWDMRRSVFGGGALQMGAVGAVLAAGGIALSLPWQGALLCGFALALSSTAIAVQTMQERRAMGSPMGRTAFSILLFQDIAAIPLIGVVPLLAPVQVASDNRLLGAAKVFGAIAIVVVLGRYLTRPVLRVMARTHLREIFTACTLLLIMAIAALMNAVGVSMGLGAFLAGVLLASSEYRHALETDIEPFKGLLLGLFFMAIGMTIDFGLFRQHGLLIAALVIGFLMLKLGALYAIAGRLGVERDKRLEFAALLAQGGEFAFVVFREVKKVNLLGGDWDALLSLVVALSMAFTPILMLVVDAIDARKRAGNTREADVIDEHAPIIIAGFGRFGQIVGRVLLASGLKATVLDYDPDQIDVLRRFNFRIFYGDATRLDLLEAAGAKNAKVIVNAIDNVDANLALVDVVKHHFPHLKIVTRARNVTHWFELRRRGITAIERELFEGSLRTGRAALEAIGVPPYEARERVDHFRRLNVATLEEILPDSLDETQRISLANAARTQLETQIQREMAALDKSIGKGWHEEDET